MRHQNFIKTFICKAFLIKKSHFIVFADCFKGSNTNTAKLTAWSIDNPFERQVIIKGNLNKAKII